VPSQQPQGQLQAEHSADTGNYIMGKQNIKSKTNYRQPLEENTLIQKSKQTNKETKMGSGVPNYRGMFQLGPD
jgi:hypothetical protein